MVELIGQSLKMYANRIGLVGLTRPGGTYPWPHLTMTWYRYQVARSRSGNRQLRQKEERNVKSLPLATAMSTITWTTKLAVKTLNQTKVIHSHQNPVMMMMSRPLWPSLNRRSRAGGKRLLTEGLRQSSPRSNFSPRTAFNLITIQINQTTDYGWVQSRPLPVSPRKQSITLNSSATRLKKNTEMAGSIAKIPPQVARWRTVAMQGVRNIIWALEKSSRIRAHNRSR